MTYQDDTAAEAIWNQQCGTPGKPTVSRTHPAFKRGQQDHYQGHNECPYLAGGEASRHWRAGWEDAVGAAAKRDERIREATYRDEVDHREFSRALSGRPW